MKALARSRAHAESRDRVTRQRLLLAATTLFAERGFARVTVREICREAGANVAAVNYHFGDKERLYREVIDAALEAVRGFADQAMNAAPGSTPEEQLLHYVRAHLVRSRASADMRRGAVLRELFRRELVEPTAMGRHIVDQALRPRLAYLSGVLTALLGGAATPALVRECVMSVQSQCLLPGSAPAALGLAPTRTPAELERLATHIVQFSLGGLRARAAAAQPARAEHSGRSTPQAAAGRAARRRVV